MTFQGRFISGNLQHDGGGGAAGRQVAHGQMRALGARLGAAICAAGVEPSQ